MLLLLRIVVMLPLLLATPLPFCPHETVADPASYLLTKVKMLGCGLPLSRIYLLSQFSAVLTIDTSARLGPFYAQTKNMLTITVCQARPDMLVNMWYDDISVLKRTPWNVEACNQAEINLHGRLVSDTGFEPAFIRNLNLPDRCAFSLEFTPSVSGKYQLEVVNTWLAASTDPNPLSADPKPGRWKGKLICQEICVIVFVR